MDGMLSQEEINALLRGMTTDEDSTSAFENSENTLSDAEKDAIGEISNISMGTSATTLSSLVNQKVTITTPVVSYATWDDLAQLNKRPCVFIQIYYKEGLDGNNILILKESDVKIITDLMMGGDGSNVLGELSELHLSAISEAMNQMMGSASTSISSMLEKRVDISPPLANLVDMNETFDVDDIAPFLKEKFVKVSFKMEIGDLVDSELMQLYPFDFARDLYRKFTKEEAKDTSKVEQTNKPVSQTTTETKPAEHASLNNGQMQQNQMPYMQPMQGIQNMYGGMNYMMPPVQDVNVQPAQFQPFTAPQNPVVQPENIDLIMDVPLEVTVELGRTSKSIKEILEFSPGTIIELNKLAGEPIDVLVNGKFVAKGEVVVIEESFGIRVTEIIK
ncbi:MAG: CheC, inhibitor of methylation / FliN fusion protein [Anaerocolumna sp.]|jgi:flagellar motor switch protein FliN/FliY|nr:CheC, inhibitor of methylation / FliN fusion protein [Anaerocolumna sp.]